MVYSYLTELDLEICALKRMGCFFGELGGPMLCLMNTVGLYSPNPHEIGCTHASV